MTTPCDPMARSGKAACRFGKKANRLMVICGVVISTPLGRLTDWLKPRSRLKRAAGNWEAMSIREALRAVRGRMPKFFKRLPRL
ncbi:hypothetical protein [Streptomyces sp. 900116325]